MVKPIIFFVCLFFFLSLSRVFINMPNVMHHEKMTRVNSPLRNFPSLLMSPFSKFTGHNVHKAFALCLGVLYLSTKAVCSRKVKLVVDICLVRGGEER